jgi:hypothetical protein
MKLSEYEIFHQRVQEKIGLETSLESLAHECLKKLSIESVKEIESLMYRKIATWNIKQQMSKVNHKQSIA